jgi:YD repeat-containing protein
MSYATISEAQTNISFTYDAAGNRVKREIIIPKSSKANTDTASSIKPITELLGKLKITIYPNPTRGQLSVEITNMPTDASGEIRIYNIAGNVIQYQKTVGSLNQLDFSVYPTGVYVLYIKVGQNESKWKIIKQ